MSCNWLCEKIKRLCDKNSGDGGALNSSLNSSQILASHSVGNQCQHDFDFTTFTLINNLNNLNPTVTLKVVLIGAIDKNAGTTSICSRICGGEFSENTDPTIVFECKSVFHELQCNKCKEDTIVKMDLWETGSSKLQASLWGNFIKYCNAIVLVYDITNKDSLNDLYERINYVKDNATWDYHSFLLGNKLDLAEARQVSTEEAQNFATQNNLTFLGECSAKDNTYMPLLANSCFDEEQLLEDGMCTDGIKGIVKYITRNL